MQWTFVETQKPQIQMILTITEPKSGGHTYRLQPSESGCYLRTHRSLFVLTQQINVNMLNGIIRIIIIIIIA